MCCDITMATFFKEIAFDSLGRTQSCRNVSIEIIDDIF